METNNTDTKKSFIERYNISPILFGIISLIIIIILYQVLGGLLTFLYLIMSGDLQGFSSNNVFRISTTIGQLLFLLVPTLLLAKLLPNNFKKIFKLNKISFTLCIWIILSVIALMHIGQVILTLQSLIPLPESIQVILYKIKTAIEETYKMLVYSNSIPELGLAIIAVAIVPAICEEFLFRGLIQHTFTSGSYTKIGIVITGLLFAFFHFSPFSFIALSMIGIYLCFLVYKTNSIISSMIAHFTNNLFAVTVPYFLGRDDLIANDTTLFFTTDIFVSLFFIFLISLGLFVVSLIMIYKNTNVVSPIEE
jgi:membrane protease YdiL (CAAX protease family)